MKLRLSLLSSIFMFSLLWSCNNSEPAIVQKSKTIQNCFTNYSSAHSSYARGVYIPKYIQKKVEENAQANMAGNLGSATESTNTANTKLVTDIPGIYQSQVIKDKCIENKNAPILSMSTQ